MKYSRVSSTQRGYDRHWRKVRDQVLASEPLCRMCKADGKLVPASVVDHIVKIQDAPSLRLDKSNMQPLCAMHHDGAKAKHEARGYSTEVGRDGWPTDPQHPANRKGRGGGKLKLV